MMTYPLRLFGAARFRSLVLIALAVLAFVAVSRPAVVEAVVRADGVVTWASSSTPVALSGDDLVLNVAISTFFGDSGFVGSAVSVPRMRSPRGAAPVALPAAGNGDFEDDDEGTPAWLWGVIAAVGVVAVSAGAAYRIWLRSRQRHR